MFYQNGGWTKPAGVSQVYMMLIGGGATGDGSTVGGSSGNVTTWFGAAQNVPDNLVVSPAAAVTSTSNGNSTTVNYRGSSLSTLLTASGGLSSGTSPTSDTANTFGNSGFYKCAIGQTGSATTVNASTTTFLSGGGGGSSTSAGNYGYSVPTFANGFFMLQPMIVACSTTITVGNGSRNPIGCGSCLASTIAGPGFVLIASW